MLTITKSQTVVKMTTVIHAVGQINAKAPKDALELLEMNRYCLNSHFHQNT